jgi:hypothetical protein
MRFLDDGVARDRQKAPKTQVRSLDRALQRQGDGGHMPNRTPVYLVALAAALYVPSSWAGYGLGSPTLFKPSLHDLVLVDAVAADADLRVGGQVVQSAEDFSIYDLGATFDEGDLASAELALFNVDVKYTRDGVPFTVHFNGVVLPIDIDCAVFEDRVVPAGVVDPDGDGVISPPALKGWLETAPCN